MINNVLFWFGVSYTMLIGFRALYGSGNLKNSAVAAPFALLLAAAVAKYLGY